jgi:hypothetical protein
VLESTLAFGWWKCSTGTSSDNLRFDLSILPQPPFLDKSTIAIWAHVMAVFTRSLRSSSPLSSVWMWSMLCFVRFYNLLTDINEIMGCTIESKPDVKIGFVNWQIALIDDISWNQLTLINGAISLIQI